MTTETELRVTANGMKSPKWYSSKDKILEKAKR